MAKVLRRAALIALCVTSWCLDAATSRVLFPTSLHLTRQIHDPLSGGTTTIEEYCAGNRMVAVSGVRTVIVDYEKQEVTEIDRAKGTYSVSRFDEIASAVVESQGSTMVQSAAPKPADAAHPRWKVTPLGQRGGANGRSVEQFEFVDESEQRRKVDVGIDRGVALTREAVEVLIGAAYPNPTRDEHEAVLRAASARTDKGIATNDAGAASNEPTYGLPVTQSFTYAESGSEVTFRTTVTRVGAEVVPPEALIIPPAAKRVESRAAAMRRQLRELDQPASSTAPREN